MTVRVGLIGTGIWASRVHAPSLATAPDVEFAGLWSRSVESRERFAADFGVAAFPDPEALMEAVDVVAFAVPPQVQAELAPRAAAIGRDLLLEKPASLDIGEAERLADAVAAAGARAVVFVTRLFDPVRLEWLRAERARGWTSAHAEFVSATLSLGAYRGSTWRQVSGALWDVGPHVLSQLEIALGPVCAVAVDEAAVHGDVRVRFEHEHGISSAHLNEHSDTDALVETIRLGEQGDGVMSPPAGISYPESYALALGELLRPGGDPLLEGASIRAGVATVRTLATAQSLIDAGRLGSYAEVPRG